MPCRQLYFILSGVCLLIGVTTTHGLGGQLRHAIPTEAGDEITRTWRFFQPFQYVADSFAWQIDYMAKPQLRGQWLAELSAAACDVMPLSSAYMIRVNMMCGALAPEKVEVGRCAVKGMPPGMVCGSGRMVLCRGGIVFAATQALGWGLFSGSLLCLIYLVTTAARGMAYCIRCWIFATGSVMLASQLVSPYVCTGPLQQYLHAPCTSEACAHPSSSIKAGLRSGNVTHQAVWLVSVSHWQVQLLAMLQ